MVAGVCYRLVVYFCVYYSRTNLVQEAHRLRQAYICAHTVLLEKEEAGMSLRYNRSESTKSPR